MDRIIKITLALLLCVSMVFIGGCTKYASQNDTQKLEEARQAAGSAEKELKKVVVERQQLEDNLAQKESELAEANAELENVKNR